jgi:hypothetical protein
MGRSTRIWQIRRPCRKVNPDEAPVVKTENFMYRNKGDYTFDKMNAAWGMDQKVHTRGAIYADLDKDGDLDLILNNMDEGPLSTAIRPNNSLTGITFDFG